MDAQAATSYKNISNPPPTALEVAAAACAREVVDELLAAGAQLEKRMLELAERNEGSDGDVYKHIKDILLPPLHRAAGGDDIGALEREMAKIKAEAKSAFTFRDPMQSMTPLHHAVMAGRAQNCTRLINAFNFSPAHPHGTQFRWYQYSYPFDDLKQKNPQGELPLHVAVKQGVEVCQAMLPVGLPKDVRELLICSQDSAGQVPLAVAVLEGLGDSEVCRYLERQHINMARPPSP